MSWTGPAAEFKRLNDIPEERPEIGEPELPHDHFRRAPTPFVLVARDLAHTISLLQRLHEHFLLDGGQVRCEPQLLRDVLSNGTKAILAVGEAHIPPVVDRQHDELGSEIANELLDGAVQLVAAA